MGNLIEYVKMAIQNIKSNKGRSFLTMLGIIIGIASVILIRAVGAGVTKSMNSQLNDIAGGQIMFSVGAKGMQEGITGFTDEDIEAIGEIEGVESVVPNIFSGGSFDGQRGNVDISISGGSEYSVQNLVTKLKMGRYYTNEEVETAGMVALVTKSDAKRLFGSEDVLGMSVDVILGDGTIASYRIIGVLDDAQEGGLISFSYEGAPVSLYVPWTSILNYTSLDAYPGAMIYSDKMIDSKTIGNKMIKLLEGRYQVESQKGYFTIESFQDQLGEINEALNMMTTFVALVGTISLVVGGIGVMNIMLVSVTERTREIGIRKSLGAKTTSIMTQFLAESAILTVIGGVIGILLGWLGATGVASALSTQMKMSVQAVVSLEVVVVATLFSMAVGIFFGLYPARKAAKMNPIEALRRE